MGPDARDDASFTHGPVHLLRVPLEPLANPPRLAVVRTPKWSLATDAQRGHFEETITRLESAGATMKEVSLPHLFDDAWDNVMLILCRDAVKSFASIESRHRISLSPPLLEVLDRGHRITPEQYNRAREKRENYRRWFEAMFERHDAIITIPATGEAPQGLASTGDASFNSLWTQAGLPAITVPSGRGPRGLPLGTQVVGRYRDDERALQVAAWMESTLGFAPGLAGGEG
jgi:amidase